MRIQGDRVCLLHAFEQFSRRFREYSKRAITSIHVHPKLEVVRSLSDLGQRIDRASVHSSGVRNYAERNVPSFQVSDDFCNKIVRPDSEALVQGDITHILPPDSQKRRCLGDGKMRLARCIEPQGS